MHPLRKFYTGLLVQALGLVRPEERPFAEAYRRLNVIDGYLDSPWQERWLFNMARALPPEAVLVEIGSFKGRSTACLALGCLGSARRIYAIDIFDGSRRPSRQEYFPEFQANLARCQVDHLVQPIKGRSAEIAADWQVPIDFLFIDGDHSYEGVLADFHGYFPHVKPCGLVALHDVSRHWPGVLRAWHAIGPAHLNTRGFCGSLAYGNKPAA